MKLVYRGASYDYTPSKSQTDETVQTIERDRGARSLYRLNYRGTVYAVNPNVKPKKSFFHPIANLMYRGVAYSLNG
ncbi:DUF4278 domain-containing protein [Kovacikia minuta CCNUW1]|uniref:DUF4278 domain-containing protein n=1 Tax=Kovacikia minuta TaxID=2931930 RepID=UPI001CCA5179|nr:DUF4278 domain-containing protein [Kovacikia minuta]UBF28787.1 DUF4278 domain-containing protein [Kovacikia minuta CCNUW1]